MFLIALWRNLVYRRRVESDLDEEMRSVQDLLADERIRSGVAPEAARRAAALEIGGVEQVKERVRDEQAGALLDSVRRDANYAIRTMRRDAGFTAVTVFTLALGIGLSHTMFTLLNALVLRGLPIEQPGRVLYVQARTPTGTNGGLSFREYTQIIDNVRDVIGMAAYVNSAVAIGDDRKAPERVVATYASASSFGLLKQRVTLGRDFHEDDDKPGAAPVVILGDAVWRSLFAANPAVIGQTTRINGVVTTVIGVMPGPFAFPNTTEVWLPLIMRPGPWRSDDQSHDLNLFGRVVDGVRVPEAVGHVNAVTATFLQDPSRADAHVRFIVAPINERYSNGGITSGPWLAFIAVAIFVVLVACATAANLLFAHAATRRNEIATRTSLGATRTRIVRQLLVEGAVTASLSGAIGALLSIGGIQLMLHIMPTGQLPYWMDFSPDWRVIWILVALTASTVFVFALLPAIHAARADVQDGMRDGGRLITRRNRTGAWAAMFMVAELALTVSILNGVVTTIRQVTAPQSVEAPIDASAYVAAWVQLPAERYPSPESRIRFYGELQQRMAAISSRATMTSNVPSGDGPARQLEIAGEAPRAERPSVTTVAVGAAYFDTLGLPLVRGRSFIDGDGTAGHQVAIVNERLAQLYFANQDPIGRSVRLTDDPSRKDWLTIVGVSPSVRQQYSREALDPVVYLPYNARPPAITALIVRADRNPAAVMSALRTGVHAVDPDVPMYDVMMLDEAIRIRRWWIGEFSPVLIYTIGAIVLMMTVVGLFTVTVHSVHQRREEIGVRQALGAMSHQIVWLVLRRTVVQLALGLVASLLLGLAWSRVFPQNAPSSGVDLSVLVPSALLVVVIALAACVWPARRATRLDPVQVLRCD